jgi:hypothetical protein
MKGKNIQTFLVTVFICFSGCSLLSNDFYEEGFRGRVRILTDHTADQYNPPSFSIPDPEKFYWPKIMARFEKYGQEDSLSNIWIEQLKHRSPFHFTLVGMARLMSIYDQAPALKNNKLLLLQNVFERSDSHNPWTSEGTENHLAMDRTSGYIFAQHALDFPYEFPDAHQKLELIKEWISQWSQKIFRYGTGEWNSSTYQTYHINGWLNLYDFADDPDVRQMARAVLDYYAAEMALHYSWGTYGGSEKRGRGAVDINVSASNYLCWLWFGSHYEGDSFLPQGSEYIQSMHAVTSTYRPPSQAVALAGKNFTSPEWYQNSKPSYLFEEQSFVKQFYYIGKNFTLGTAVSPYGGWTGSTYQLVNWKLIIKREDSPTPWEVSGNGRFHDAWTGMTGNPWTQFAQHKNLLIQLTRTPVNKNELIEEVRKVTMQWATDWQRDFLRRFPGDPKPNVVNFARNILAENTGFINLPMDSRTVFTENNCYVDLGEVFLAIMFVSSETPSDSLNILDVRGRKVITDQAPDGKLCGFLFEVVNRSDWPSFNEFIDAHMGNAIFVIDEDGVAYKSLSGDYLEMDYKLSGRFTEAIYDWGYGAVEQQTLITAPPFRQPDWPEGDGYGKLPVFKVNESEFHWDEPWPVYSGPRLTVENGIMKISDENSVYIVDYTGDIPKFNNRKK